MAAESTHPEGDDRGLSRLLSVSDLVSLVTTGEALAGTIDHSALLRRILEIAGQLTDSPAGSILLHDPRRDTLYFAAATGDDAESLLKDVGEHATKQIPTDDSNAGEVFRERRTQIKQALKSDPSHFKGVDQATQKITKSMITLPLIAADECIGVMQMLNKRSGDYTERDRVLLEQFASQAALALRNARLIADLLAHMGLYVRGQKKRTAQELITKLSTPPHHEWMTVMFADLRGFRSLCQQINNPEKLTEMLNQFLSILVDQVLAHDGVVNKYLGDGILAFFQNENHELAAVNCAFAIIDAFEPIKASWPTQTIVDVEFLEVGFGICTEQITIGPVGSERVKDYTVIGTPVNLAAAFESEARGEKQVLVDQTTFHKVKDKFASDPPIVYQLRQPDQQTGHPYKQYNLHRKESPPILCFISYSHMDEALVGARVVDVLKQEKMDYWLAPDVVEPGKDFTSEISKGLEKADYVLLIVSKNSVKSEWVRREISLALTSDPLADRIIPVRTDETLPKEINAFLSSIQQITLDDIAKASRRFTPRADASRATSVKV